MRSIVLLILFVFIVSCKSSGTKSEDSDTSKDELKWKKSKLLFEDDGSTNWKDKWFLDGLQVSIENTEQGMNFAAGKEWKNDSSHAVLWTKDTFEGNILIEYDFTRTDSTGNGVIIIYFHATGKGVDGYPEDLYAWRDKRTVPTMSIYFRNMDAYHISYSTNQDINDDYVRLRRYEHQYRLKGTEILPDNFKTGLFEYGITYHIEIQRIEGQIMMSVTNTTNPTEQRSFQWDVSDKPLYKSGRIGLRHMYTRSGRYKDFKVWSLNK